MVPTAAPLDGEGERLEEGGVLLRVDPGAPAGAKSRAKNQRRERRHCEAVVATGLLPRRSRRQRSAISKIDSVYGGLSICCPSGET